MPMQLLEIENERAAPDGDAALARHDAVLAGLETRIAEAMRSGLAPDDYARVAELREANVVARKILRISVRKDGE